MDLMSLIAPGSREFPVCRGYGCNQMEPDCVKAIFEWDEARNRINQDKHGISFEQARQAFADPNRLVFAGMDHTAGEERLFCLGVSNVGLITVRFTCWEKSILIFGASFWREGKGIFDTRRGSVH